MNCKKLIMNQEEKRIAESVDVLVARQSRMAQDSFKEEYGVLGIQMEQLEKKQADLQQERTDREYRARQSKLFLKVIEGLEVGSEIDSELFLALVDKVIVSDGLTFTLKYGEAFSGDIHRSTLTVTAILIIMDYGLSCEMDQPHGG